MKRRHLGAISGAAIIAVTLTAAAGSAQAIPKQADPVQADKTAAVRHDNLPNPLADKQAQLRKDAVSALVKGEATTEVIGGQRVIKMDGSADPSNTTSGKADRKNANAGDKFVSYPVNREEDIFTVLTEFGDQTDPRTGGEAGPQKNQIPKPDRTWDGDGTDNNSTYWLRDFNRAHYMDLMFGEGESFKDFYLKQSNGRFLAKGDVSDWVTVPSNEARYGNNDIPESDGYWQYIEDTGTAWYDDQVAQGKSADEIKTYLAQFDRVDRYDADGDGNFNEPDGYIDHFQAIHAGEGEEAGGGAEGEDAIWSHRWYVNSTDQGQTGPEGAKLGGTQIGDTGMWIGDYTTEPENGGLGVFAHEFGHDLGLPDLYDTAGGDNGTGFWTLMSGGSWMNKGGNSIGTTPGYMGAWEKLQLGWLDYQTVDYGQNRNLTVGPADRDGKNHPQAALVTLPDQVVSNDYNTPASGEYEWWSGMGDDLQNTLTRDLDLTGATAPVEMTAQAQYSIEQDYDYLYSEVSTDGGSTWTQIGDPIGGEQADWTEISLDLSAYAGQDVKFRFRYATDGGLALSGAFLDDLAVTAGGEEIFADDVESGDNGWTADGFTRMTGSTTETAAHYYLAENRVYSGYDHTLKTGPYNFGYGDTRPDWVERFPYQNGLLVWYVNEAYADNNTSAHPGGGEVLPVDARPTPVVFESGALLGNRRQPFDATFGQEATDAVTFHSNGVPTTVPAQRALPKFDDTNPEAYWSSANPGGSVKVAGTGTSIRVANTTRVGQFMDLQVRFAAPSAAASK